MFKTEPLVLEHLTISKSWQGGYTASIKVASLHGDQTLNWSCRGLVPLL